MSNMTRPNPPPCSTRSVALNARSRSFLPRIHNKRSNAIPACAADAGSNLSPKSISAHTSSPQVAWAKTESSTLVRPDELVPIISVMALRGRPFESASISAMPVVNVSNENFPRGCNELPKRLVSADSISFFEIAALTADQFNTFESRPPPHPECVHDQPALLRSAYSVDWRLVIALDCVPDRIALPSRRRHQSAPPRSGHFQRSAATER